MKRSLFRIFFVVLIGVFSSGSYEDGFHAKDYVSIAYGIRSDAAKFKEVSFPIAVNSRKI